MRATFWGVRGSLASPGPDTVRYGGNTSCVELRLADGTVAILDAGTGMRPLGRRLVDEGVTEVHIFLTHLHLDHLQGLAFFAPLYRKDMTVHIWGPPSPLHALAQRISGYMSDPLFPVHLTDVPARTMFHDAPGVGARVGSAVVQSAPLVHLGPTIGHRFQEGTASLVYIPDHEPSLGIDLRRVDPSWVSGVGLARDSDVLIHDCQYTEAEYDQHVGWGHSSVAHVVQLARMSAVRQLVLFHFDPSHTDEIVDLQVARAGQLWGPEGRAPIAAREGTTLVVEDATEPRPGPGAAGGHGVLVAPPARSE